MTNPNDFNWRLEAACKGMAPDIFYSEDPVEEEEAYSICRTCPVTVECFISAVEEETVRRNVPGLGGSITGIRGGKSPRVRWQVLQGNLTVDQALNLPIPVYNIEISK